MEKEIKSIIMEVLNQNNKILRMNLLLIENLSKPITTINPIGIINPDELIDKTANIKGS